MEILLNAYKDTIKPKARFFEVLGCSIWFFICLAIDFALRYWFLGFAVWTVLIYRFFYNPQFMLREIRKTVKEDSASEFESTIKFEITANGVVQYTSNCLYLWVTRTWFIFLSNHGSIILKKARIRALYSQLTTGSQYSLVIEYDVDSVFAVACGTDSDEIVQLVDITKKDGKC